MAGETVSLDYTQPAPGETESETPFLPGMQVVHTPDARLLNGGFWQVRRVTARSSVKLAARGVAEEVYLYPRRYETFEDAVAAAQAAYAKDGPGDVGVDATLAAHVAQQGHQNG